VPVAERRLTTKISFLGRGLRGDRRNFVDGEVEAGHGNLGGEEGVERRLHGRQAPSEHAHSEKIHGSQAFQAGPVARSDAVAVAAAGFVDSSAGRRNA